MARGGKPKKKGGNDKKRAEEAKKNAKNRQKISEDRTFGLKNKNKSKKVQQKIRIIRSQSKNIGKTRQDIAREEAKKKEREKKREQQKLEKEQMRKMGVRGGAKSGQICPFFLKGSCRKGKRCGFSHSQPKGQLNVYADPRDSMTSWDQETLEKIVASRDSKPMLTTDIICRYFLDAIEQNKYGHFWKCPNGNKDCIYRHRLPQGFVLRKEKTAEEILAEADQDNDAIAEKIEEQRRQLDISNCTPLTFEIFEKWRTERKQRLDAEREAELKAAMKKNAKTQEARSILSGRRLFEFDPTLFQDDAEAAGADDMTLREEEVEGEEAAKLAADGQTPGPPVQAWAAPLITPQTTMLPENPAPAPSASGDAKEETTAARVPKTKSNVDAEGKKKKRRKRKKKGGKKKAAAAAAAAAAQVGDAAAPAPAAAPASVPAPVASLGVQDASLFLMDMDDEDLPDSD